MIKSFRFYQYYNESITINKIDKKLSINIIMNVLLLIKSMKDIR